MTQIALYETSIFRVAWFYPQNGWNWTLKVFDIDLACQLERGISQKDEDRKSFQVLGGFLLT